MTVLFWQTFHKLLEIPQTRIYFIVFVAFVALLFVYDLLNLFLESIIPWLDFLNWWTPNCNTFYVVCFYQCCFVFGQSCFQVSSEQMSGKLLHWITAVSISNNTFFYFGEWVGSATRYARFRSTIAVSGNSSILLNVGYFCILLLVCRLNEKGCCRVRVAQGYLDYGQIQEKWKTDAARWRWL